jgi:uncharacterized phage protein gp47/JayE
VLNIVSAIPSGVDSKAVVASGGISGGTDAETDEEYLARVLVALRSSVRYGRKGDYTAWAIEATAEVTDAWEYKNFGVFGALLVQVINGNHTDGIRQVGNLTAVKDHISDVSPPIIFDVRTPSLISINPEIKLSHLEDTQENRDLAERRLKAYLQQNAQPGIQITTGALRVAIIDGIRISDAVIKLAGDIIGVIKTTILEYPVLGAVTWV